MSRSHKPDRYSTPMTPLWMIWCNARGQDGILTTRVVNVTHHSRNRAFRLDNLKLGIPRARRDRLRIVRRN